MARSDEVTSLLSLDGNSAVVTGAATGIGREIARLLHAAGAKVIGGDINEAELKTLALDVLGTRSNRLQICPAQHSGE